MSSQVITHLFKSPNSTRALNNHIAKIVAEGPYKGLEIEKTSPPSFSVDITEGYALTNEGVKIEQTLPAAGAVTFNPPDPNFPRIDLVVLRFRYTTPINTPLYRPEATFHVIQGIPVPPPELPIAPDKQVFAEGMTPPNWVQEGDIPLAEVHMIPGSLWISDAMIFNRIRTMTTTEMMAAVAKALYLAVGNFVYWGWDLTSDWLNVIVSPGEGLLCGYVNNTSDPFVLTTLRAREYLFDPLARNMQTRLIMNRVDSPGFEDSHNLGDGDNLSLDRQPEYPSILRIIVRPRDCTTEGYVRITGKDEKGNTHQEEVYVTCPVVGETVVVETVTRFSEVFPNHIDANTLNRVNGHIEFTITDKPLAYIYAVGTGAGRAVFKAVYNPAYIPPCNELLLGIAETDDEKVIHIETVTNDAYGELEEDLSAQCDGHRRVFVMRNPPRENSVVLIMDGSVLKKNSINNKGYILDGARIELQPGVPTPDGDAITEGIHGGKGTDLWVRYRRQMI